jgi:hypothetical protein
MGGLLIFLYAYGGKHKSAVLLAWRRRVQGVTAFFTCHVIGFDLMVKQLYLNQKLISLQS